MGISVNYSELGPKDGSSPGGSYGWKGGATFPRQIRVKWSDRQAGMQQCVGYSYPLTSGGTRYLRRQLPEGVPWWDTTLHCTNARIVRGETWTGRAAYDQNTYALLPGYPNTTATKSDDSAQGYSAGSPTDSLMKENRYRFAVLALEFQAADFYIRSDGYVDGNGGNESLRYVSFREDRQAKGIIVPGSVMYFVTGANPAESIPFSVPRIEFEKTIFWKWHQVAVDAVPWNTIDTMIGSVNKLTFGTIYPPDSLLMLAPRVDRYVMANGLIGCDIEFAYGYTPNLQTKLLHCTRDNNGNANLVYKWVTGTSTQTIEPVPGTLVDGQWLFNERDFYQAFVPNNP